MNTLVPNCVYNLSLSEYDRLTFDVLVAFNLKNKIKREFLLFEVAQANQ